jgi:hypothetical protein
MWDVVVIVAVERRCGTGQIVRRRCLMETTYFPEGPGRSKPVGEGLEGTLATIPRILLAVLNDPFGWGEPGRSRTFHVK